MNVKAMAVEPPKEKPIPARPPTSVPISEDAEWSPGLVRMLCSRELSVAPVQNETMTPPLFTPLDYAQYRLRHCRTVDRRSERGTHKF